MNSKKQQGLSTIGLIFVIGVFGLLLITGFKVVPLYMDFYQVQTIIKSINNDPSINVKSKRDLWQAINKRLRINNMRSFNSDDFIVSRENKKTTITIEYTVKEPYIANLFIGADFKKSIEFDR